MFSLKKDLNEIVRQAWLKKTLGRLPAGLSILDIGAGEQKNKTFCEHLKYVSQDFCEYDGLTDAATVGLHSTNWNTDKIDVVSDILQIPCTDASFDIILCSEVLEHVPEPTLAIQEFFRLLKPNGVLILTAPFASFLHMAPYHFSTGFTRYWYEHHLLSRGFSITELEPNGDWSSVLIQELQRVSGLARINKSFLWPFIFLYASIGCNYLRLRRYLAPPDFACFGFHCVAVKR